MYNNGFDREQWKSHDGYSNLFVIRFKLLFANLFNVSWMKKKDILHPDYLTCATYCIKFVS